MTPTNIQLKRFDPMTALAKPFTMICLGKRNSGKTSLVRDFLFRLNNIGYPRVVVFSGTEEATSFYYSIIPKAYIHNGLDLSVLKTVVDAQRKIMASVCEAKQQIPVALDTRLIIIFDDVSYSKQACRNELMNMLFLNGRHYNISIIMTLQYLISLSPEGRSNCDYICCLKDSIPKSRARTYECFGGMFSRKQDFFTVLDQTTVNYETLVINNVVSCLNPEDCLSWYKADITIPPFLFGSSEFHRLANQEESQRAHNDGTVRIINKR
jgi:hypothetical protein